MINYHNLITGFIFKNIGIYIEHTFKCYRFFSFGFKLYYGRTINPFFEISTTVPFVTTDPSGGPPQCRKNITQITEIVIETLRINVTTWHLPIHHKVNKKNLQFYIELIFH